MTYWGVADADAGLKSLLDGGATSDGEVRDVGNGIRVATVKDPAGNIVGIIENPHFHLDETAPPASGPGR